jgi:ABC-type multidrug transport system fused ATPase/permease subunit
MKKVTTPADEIQVSVWNFLTVEWITNILFGGAKNRISTLPQLPNQLRAENVVLPRTNQIFMYIVKKYWFQILMAIALQGASVACILLIPTYLEQIILYLNPDYPKFLLKNSDGVILALILFALQLARTVFIQTSNQFSFYLQIDLKTLLIGAVYEKSLRLSQASSTKYTQGQILNLVNVDIEKVSLAFLQFATLLMAPIQVAWSVVLLGDYLGYSVWAGAGALFAILILQVAVIGFLAKFQKEFLQFGDKRLKMIREVLYGMKIIKFRTLEKFFYDRITAIRLDQVSVLKKYYFIQVYFVGLIQVAPIVMPIGAFLTYGAANGTITAEKILPSLSLFNGLFQPILTVPQSITAIVVGAVSWKRIVSFLLAEEAQELEKKVLDTDIAVSLQSSTFVWDAVRKEEPKKAKKKWGKKPEPEIMKDLQQEEGDLFRLNEVNLEIKKGMKVAIVGAVGCGKSSLLSGLIGDMPKIAGEVQTNGKIAYCSQQPWILTDTIEGNIVFHQTFDQEKLNLVLKACGLDSDLELFPARAQTEIGEKGVNLSGGQKARVALARAMYRNPDILLLDDPISALDSQVGRLVFESGIMGYLKDKTVLLVTHQLFLLPDVDHIVVLEKGKVVEQGSFKELSEKKGYLTEMMRNYRLDDQNTTKAKEKKTAEVEEESQTNGGIIVEEDREMGSVKWKVFWHYFEKCGGWAYVITFLTAALLNSGTQVVNNLWLTWWTTEKFGLSLNTYMQVYGYLGLVQFVFACNAF